VAASGPHFLRVKYIVGPYILGDFE